MSDQNAIFSNAIYVAKLIQRIYAEQGRELIFKLGFKNEVGQHCRLLDPDNARRFHIKFAQERFKKFSLLYPNYGSGEGESISTRVIQDLGDDDLVFFATPTEILKIFVGDLKEHGLHRKNDKFGDYTWSIGIEYCEKFF